MIRDNMEIAGEYLAILENRRLNFSPCPKDFFKESWNILIRNKFWQITRYYLITHKIQVAITSKGHGDEVNHLKYL